MGTASATFRWINSEGEMTGTKTGAFEKHVQRFACHDGYPTYLACALVSALFKHFTCYLELE